MSQVYHSNARTNQHVREIIQKSNLTNVELARNYNLNVEVPLEGVKLSLNGKIENLLKIKVQDLII